MTRRRMRFGYWVKSSFSFSNGNCIETRLVVVGGRLAIAVRDSQLGDDSPVLVFRPPAWRALITAHRDEP